MKISQKQASLLARKIIIELKEKKVQKVPDEIKGQLLSFIEKRNSLSEKKREIEDSINKHDATVVKIVGKGTGIGGWEGISSMISKLEEKNIPKFQEIEDEIILNSMFASEDDMQKFVDSIVAKHSKKLQSKILSN